MKYARQTIDHELAMHKKLQEEYDGTNEEYKQRLEQRICELNAANYLLQFEWKCDGCDYVLGSKPLTGHRGCCPDANYLPSLKMDQA